MSAGEIHSTGRGGAGNIGADPNTYADGSIVREGVVGESERAGESEYSAGRGGAGNMIPSPRTGSPAPAGPRLASGEVVPQTAMRGPEGYSDFHTGRGGEGNIHRDRFGGHSKAQKEEVQHESILNKAKHLVGLDGKKKEHKESPLKKESEN